MPFYLRIDNEDLEDIASFPNKAGAVAEFEKIARGLLPYGQIVEGTIYVADYLDDFPYPDFVLGLGPRGGVRVERA